MNLKNLFDALASILLACVIVLTVEITQLVHDADVVVSAMPGQIDSARRDLVSELRLGRDSVASEVHATRTDINNQLTGAREDIDKQITGARADFNKQADVFRSAIKSLKIHVVPW